MDFKQNKGLQMQIPMTDGLTVRFQYSSGYAILHKHTYVYKKSNLKNPGNFYSKIRQTN